MSFVLPAAFSDPAPAPTPAGMGASPQRRLRIRMVLGLAAGIGLLTSTQFLMQPFVWAHWPWDEVLSAWVGIARDRIVVALAIALAIVFASRLPVRALWLRAATIVTAIVLGATTGELALIFAAAPDAADGLRSLVPHVMRWSGMSCSITSMFYLHSRATDAHGAAQSTELRRLQAERQIVQARLQTLRSQIEPHFLFNTLATVRRLHTAEPAQGAALLRHFLDYLRASLPAMHEQRSTLGQEIDLVQAYVGVIVVRMSGRLSVSVDVPDELRDCDFPPLTLATLIENAVKHGIAPSEHGGTILVQARAQGGVLDVTVADTGVGFGGSGVGGSGIGLANIRARLQTLYGTAGRLALQRNEPSGVRATMRLPLRMLEVAT